MFITVKGLNQVEHFINLSQVTRISYGGGRIMCTCISPTASSPCPSPTPKPSLLKAAINSKPAQ